MKRALEPGERRSAPGERRSAPEGYARQEGIEHLLEPSIDVRRLARLHGYVGMDAGQ